MRRCWLRALGALVLLHATVGSASAQQSGAVVAQVVDSVTGWSWPNNAENVGATGIPTGLDGMMVKVWWASQGPPN